MKKILSLKRTRFIVMAIHAILTFIWAGKVFKNIGVIPAGSVAIKMNVSDRFEQAMAYIFTELIAIILIWLLWKLVFYLINNFRRIHILFLVIFVVGVIVLALCWPYVFSVSEDNFITYACAVRLTPDYWHNAYSSFIYGACLLVFPVDFMILLVQWSFYLFAVAYIFFRVEKIAPKIKYIAFVLFILPGAFLIIRDSYRIFQYLIISVIFCSIIFFDIIEKRKRKLTEVIFIAVLAAFLAVWRSEGVLWASAFFVIYILFGSGEILRQKLLRLGIFVAAFLIISTPQGIGMEKYYGNAYHVVNTVHKLRIMLTIPEINLEYEGAEEDLAAIDAVIPHEYIMAYGIKSYLRYNTGVSGFKDINQFKATNEETKRYIAAYINIARHNPKIFMKVVADAAFVSFKGSYQFYPTTNYQPEKELPDWTFDGWDAGRGDIFSNTHTALWNIYTSKLGVGEKLCEAQAKYSGFFMTYKIYFVLFIAYLFFLAGLFVTGIIMLIRKKDFMKFSLGLFGLVILGEYLAVMIVTPAYGYTYFIITNYLVVSLLLGSVTMVARKRR